MIAAVLDTNVLASAAISTYGSPVALFDAVADGRILLVTSEIILDELEDALKKPYFAGRTTAQDRADYCAFIRSVAVIVAVTLPIPRVVPEDPDDDFIIATAVAGGVDYLVTGDKKLQALEVYEGIRIVSPREFREIIDSE